MAGTGIIERHLTVQLIRFRWRVCRPPSLLIDQSHRSSLRRSSGSVGAFHLPVRLSKSGFHPTTALLHLCMNVEGGETQPQETAKSETMERDEEILPALGYLAAGTTAMLAKLSKEALAPFDIPPVQIGILMYCSRNHTTTTERLVGAIHLDQASVSRHIAVLVEKGLIRRTRPYDDRRVVRVDLTEEGWAFMPRLVEALQETNTLINIGIDEEDKRVFLDVMRRIHENLRTGMQEISNAATAEVRGGADD